MKYWLLLGCALLFVSCNESSTEELKVEEVAMEDKKDFEMYEVSEMAAIMQHMYKLNEQLKERIESGEELGSFSESFERMLNAKMTNDKTYG